MGGFCTGRIFHAERNFQGLNFSREVLHCVNLPEFLPKLLYMSCRLFTDSILGVEMLRVIFQGKFSPGLNYPEDISLEREIFP